MGRRKRPVRVVDKIKPDELPSLLNTDEVAIILRKSRDAVLKDIQRGLLPAYKFRREYRIKLEDLQHLLASMPTATPLPHEERDRDHHVGEIVWR